MTARAFVIICFVTLLGCPEREAQTISGTSKCTGPILNGQAAFTSWRSDAPGICRRFTAADLPPPFATPSEAAGPNVVPQPRGVSPNVPFGFKVEQFYKADTPGRRLLVAPNDDVLISVSSANFVRLLRSRPGQDVLDSAFVRGLNRPFGLQFFPLGKNPQWLYIANTDSIVRVSYQNGDIAASGPVQTVVSSIPGGNTHEYRDLVFSPDGSKMYVGVGSASNAFEAEAADETNRATILEFNPDGSGFRVFTSGIRNAAGLAFNPTTGVLWASVNERDNEGDNLVPDYVTHVQDGGFYGWPWYYTGGNPDPNHINNPHPELKSKVIVGDVLVQAHSVPLQISFYSGSMFPEEYIGDAFVSLRGSWNRGNRTGYKVIRVPMDNGIATGEYQDFMTGLVINDADVWARPVGVAVANDGALLVSEDGGGIIWRISYVGLTTTSSTTTVSEPTATSGTVSSSTSSTLTVSGVTITAAVTNTSPSATAINGNTTPYYGK